MVAHLLQSSVPTRSSLVHHHFYAWTFALTAPLNSMLSLLPLLTFESFQSAASTTFISKIPLTVRAGLRPRSPRLLSGTPQSSAPRATTIVFLLHSASSFPCAAARSFTAPMHSTATPKHALQRTAPHVTAPASTAAFPPTMQLPRRLTRPPSHACPLRLFGPPPSLSLGSFGDFACSHEFTSR